MEHTDLEALRPDWTAENILECGKPLFEAVPDWLVPNWAGSVLFELATDRFMNNDLEQLIALCRSDNADDWKKADAAFSAIRASTLSNHQDNLSNSLEQMILDVAETTAKVTYNASGCSTPFDKHAGWRLAPQVKRTVEKIGDRHLEQVCWNLLIRQHP